MNLRSRLQRLESATATPTLAQHRAALERLSAADVLTLYRERVQQHESAEDLSTLTANELLMLYRERTC